jgi:hypothetical protein
MVTLFPRLLTYKIGQQKIKMNNIESLLKEVWLSYYAIEEANKRFASQLAPHFSLFDFMPSDENALSIYIASLLNPNGTHGQGDKYLREFLKLVKHTDWLLSENVISCEVITEKQANGQRRIDIYLKFGCGLIAIENKPWAVDQDNQLSDYAKFLQQSLPKSNENNWLLIYLSNGEPDRKSISPAERKSWEENGNFTIFDFHALLGWLEICCAKTQPLSVRVFIEELMKYIRSNINGELDMTSEAEIKDIILNNNENLIATFQIFNSMRSVKENLLNDFKSQLELKVRDYENWTLEWNIKINSRWAAYSSFGIKFASDSDLILKFEFDGSDLTRLLWGVSRLKGCGVVNKNWAEIGEKLNKRFGNGGSSDYWPWWSWDLKSLSNDDNIEDWYRHPIAWQMIQDKTFVDNVVELAQEVYKLFQDDLSILKIEH